MKSFLFNFQKQFATKVESGEKRQTIRAFRADGRLPKVGDMAKCYTGLRTSGARLLVAAPVTKVSKVLIDFDEHVIALDCGRLDAGDAEALARADGFDSFAAMMRWFREYHKGAAIEGQFEGFMTEWHSSKGGVSRG
jgi:hypothetical protein